MKKLSILLAAFLLILACNKDDDDGIPSGPNPQADCMFVDDPNTNDGAIDSIEQAIMTSCYNSAFTTAAELENNLIGNWELVGHGEGWVWANPQPCSSIEVSQGEMVFEFKNSYIDTLINYTWTVETVNWSGGDYFRIKTEPEPFQPLNILSVYCSDYMYGDATPLDGNMYIYQKQ